MVWCIENPEGVASSSNYNSQQTSCETLMLAVFQDTTERAAIDTCHMADALYSQPLTITCHVKLSDVDQYSSHICFEHEGAT